MRISDRARGKGGFSLIEVALATGLGTFVLLVIAGLLPVGMGVFLTATQQTIETEIFNELWADFNTTPFSSLGTAAAPTSPLVNATATSPFWFDANGDQLSSSAGAVYDVRCSLVNSASTPAPAATVPAVDGGSGTIGSSPYLNFVKIQIGYHIDPLTASATDPRVITRTLLLVKRD
jgi:uncharacterized protein (TIGR02598 family)